MNRVERIFEPSMNYNDDILPIESLQNNDQVHRIDYKAQLYNYRKASMVFNKRKTLKSRINDETS